MPKRLTDHRIPGLPGHVPPLSSVAGEGELWPPPGAWVSHDEAALS